MAASERRGDSLKGCQDFHLGVLTVRKWLKQDRQGQDLALTVLYVPFSVEVSEEAVEIRAPRCRRLLRTTPEAALEATQGQNDSFSGQFPYK